MLDNLPELPSEHQTPLQKELAAFREQLLTDIREELAEFREQLLTDLAEEFIVSRAKKSDKAKTQDEPGKKRSSLIHWLNEKV